MNEQKLMDLMAAAEQRAFDMLTEDGAIPPIALLVNSEETFVFPMNSKSEGETDRKTALLSQSRRDTNADAVLYITQAMVRAGGNGRNKECILIAGATREQRLIKTLPFKRRGDDIYFGKDGGIKAIGNALSVKHPVIANLWR